MSSREPICIERYPAYPSEVLGRDVVIDAYLPPLYQEEEDWDLLILFDGQDALRLGLAQTLVNWLPPACRPLLVVAVHANASRMQEYGIANHPDFKNRGNLAGATSVWVMLELLPMLRMRYPVTLEAKRTFVAGFSLSGLMAFDLAWHNPDLFGGAAVFSGSFWWRKKALGPDYDDATDRIMHALVRAGKYRKGQKFWFQAGTADETDDRNGNGVIDAIDDTLDLMTELKAAGCPPANMRYHEVEGGTHAPETWGKVLPEMLHWLINSR